MILPQEVIRKKRDGGVLSADEIAAFVDGLTSGRISEGQVAAFAMAVFFNGMTRTETIALTRAMTDSGRRLSRRPSRRPGGRQAFDRRGRRQGEPDPRAAGRGLWRLRADDLGPRPRSHRRHPRQAREHPRLSARRRTSTGCARWCAAAGCAIIGQTEDLAPADRRLYAIRDVTATVESTPLIVASILSKKLAAGLHALVMDVKVGSGAFLPSLEAARELARELVEVAEGAGLPCSACSPT